MYHTFSKELMMISGEGRNVPAAIFTSA